MRDLPRGLAWPFHHNTYTLSTRLRDRTRKEKKKGEKENTSLPLRAGNRVRAWLFRETGTSHSSMIREVGRQSSHI